MAFLVAKPKAFVRFKPIGLSVTRARAGTNRKRVIAQGIRPTDRAAAHSGCV